jgi:hypothetical protein
MVCNTQNLWVSGFCSSFGILNSKRTSENRNCFLLQAKFALYKGPNRVGVTICSPEDGNRPTFLYVLFSSYLEFRTVDKAQKLSVLREQHIHHLQQAVAPGASLEHNCNS